VDGQVTGNIRGAGGSIDIFAAVGGDVIIDLDTLTVSSSASISGDLTYTSDNEAEIQSGALIGGATTHKDAPWRGSWALPSLAGAWVIWQVVSFLMILLAGVIVVLIAGRRLRLMAGSIQK
jgi:hypothetical protein